jgi:hypothetical protein
MRFCDGVQSHGNEEVCFNSLLIQTKSIFR